MREIKKLIIHCSASDNLAGNKFEAIKEYHTRPTNKGVWFNGKWEKGRGWKDIGYHFFIDPYAVVHNGRRVEIVGAHVEGHNFDSIGICLAGLKEFRPEQFTALRGLLVKLCTIYQLNPLKDVYPHNYFTDKKTCPNFDLKGWLKKEFGNENVIPGPL